MALSQSQLSATKVLSCLPIGEMPLRRYILVFVTNINFKDTFEYMC
jgi:hypothetical protein